MPRIKRARFRGFSITQCKILLAGALSGNLSVSEQERQHCANSLERRSTYHWTCPTPGLQEWSNGGLCPDPAIELLYFNMQTYTVEAIREHTRIKGTCITVSASSCHSVLGPAPWSPPRQRDSMVTAATKRTMPTTQQLGSKPTFCAIAPTTICWFVIL
jgi:hypothetical protein